MSEQPEKRTAEQLRAILTEDIREALAEFVEDGEMVTTWLVIAGTRHFDGGGAVLIETCDEAMPQWEVRGLLATAMKSVDRSEDGDQ